MTIQKKKTKTDHNARSEAGLAKLNLHFINDEKHKQNTQSDSVSVKLHCISLPKNNFTLIPFHSSQQNLKFHHLLHLTCSDAMTRHQ